MKTILITGATDGIGRLATQKLVALGYRILAHGRDQQKLESLIDATVGQIEPWLADLADLSDVRGMCRQILRQHERLDRMNNVLLDSKISSAWSSDFGSSCQKKLES